jgi:hypothetical protein
MRKHLWPDLSRALSKKGFFQQHVKLWRTYPALTCRGINCCPFGTQARSATTTPRPVRGIPIPTDKPGCKTSTLTGFLSHAVSRLRFLNLPLT